MSDSAPYIPPKQRRAAQRRAQFKWLFGVGSWLWQTLTACWKRCVGWIPSSRILRGAFAVAIIALAVTFRADLWSVGMRLGFNPDYPRLAQTEHGKLRQAATTLLTHVDQLAKSVKTGEPGRLLLEADEEARPRVFKDWALNATDPAVELPANWQINAEASAACVEQFDATASAYRNLAAFYEFEARWTSTSDISTGYFTLARNARAEADRIDGMAATTTRSLTNVERLLAEVEDSKDLLERLTRLVTETGDFASIEQQQPMLQAMGKRFVALRAAAQELAEQLREVSQPTDPKKE